MMSYYHVESRFSTMNKWYDGYTFGSTDVYNPWSVVNFLYDLYANIDAFPHPYWSNTSSNDIIKDMIARADSSFPLLDFMTAPRTFTMVFSSESLTKVTIT